ncbi:hypothetical protein BH23GEM6_BH23GEM6_17260 [soil metagenome]
MAESPSELRVEIEKLERKHTENPEGRYFVPLANAYRKLGTVEHAESLLRAGLRKHPEYLSAHIVLGRCYADRRSTSAAEDEFRYVLSLDSQNLVALRSLAELALDDNRPADAVQWYRELLSVDPMNEDARRVLDELGAAEQSLSQQPETQHQWASGVDDEEMMGLQWTGETHSETELESSAEQDDDLQMEVSGEQEAGWRPYDESLPSQPEAEEQSVDKFGADLLSDYSTADEVDEAPLASPPADDLLITHAPSDSHQWDESDDSTGDDEVRGELVTETIAELYARQGFYARSADVLREVIRRRGGDEALSRRLGEIERLAAGKTEASPTGLDHVSAHGSDQEEGFGAQVVDGFLQSEEAGEASGASLDDRGAEPETGDAFADSFAHGFYTDADGSDAGEDQDAVGPSTDSFAESVDSGEDDPWQTPASGDERPDRVETIADYLATLAGWQPGAGEDAEGRSPTSAESLPVLSAHESHLPSPDGEPPAGPDSRLGDSEIPREVSTEHESVEGDAAEQGFPELNGSGQTDHQQSHDRQDSTDEDGVPDFLRIESAEDDSYLSASDKRAGESEAQSSNFADAQFDQALSGLESLEPSGLPAVDDPGTGSAADDLFPWENAEGTEQIQSAGAVDGSGLTASDVGSDTSLADYHGSGGDFEAASELDDEEVIPPLPAPAPSSLVPPPGPVAVDQDDDDDDLESFQTWLRSLKR